MKRGSGKPAHPPTPGATAPNRIFTTQAHAIGDKRYQVEVLDDPFWEDEPFDDDYKRPVAVQVLTILGEAFLAVVFVLFMLDKFFNEDIVELTREAFLITIEF